MALLDAHYPLSGEPFLTHEMPWQLLVATILSARCTDDRVNATTPALFAKYPSPQALAGADFDELCRDIRSTGFYRAKAKSIIGSMIMLLAHGDIPRDINVLTAFPGVGRKTANLVLGHVYNIPGIVVDTHVMRVSARLGLSAAKDPVKIERDLAAILPKDHWIRFNTQIITHGRAVCTARGPRCGECALSACCDQRL